MPKDKDQGSIGDKNRGKTPRNEASRLDPESCCLAPENYVATARRNIVVPGMFGTGTASAWAQLLRLMTVPWPELLRQRRP